MTLRKTNMSYEHSDGDGFVQRNNTAVSTVQKPIAQQRDKSKYGDCYIFDYQKYDSAGSPRPGSENDVARLEADFIGLDFNVFIYSDLTEKQTLEILEDAAKQDYEDSKCFVCCFLTHGKEGQLLMRDSKYLKVDNILKCFSRSACRSLAGKPKILIFQACRGKNHEEGIENFEKIDLESDTSNPVSIPDFPDYLDFLLVYSTYEGSVAFRDSEGNHGSFFIDEVCRTIEDFSERLDLLQILTIVNYRIALLFECKNKDIKHKKQMPGFTSTLTSKVKFNKKIPLYRSTSTEHFENRRKESRLGLMSEENPSGDKKQYRIQKPIRIKFLFLINRKDNFEKPLHHVVSSLRSCVSKRGYQSEMLSNWSEATLKNFLEGARYFSNIDCCICFITCKAEGDYLYDVNGDRFLKKDVVAMFAANKCPMLLGKPKIFIFLMSSRTSQTNNTWDACAYPDGTDGDSATNNNAVPVHADLLEVAITIHELKQLEDVIQKLRDILGSESSEDFLSQLTYMFNDLVEDCGFYSTSNGNAAIFCLNSTLTEILEL